MEQEILHLMLPAILYILMTNDNLSNDKIGLCTLY